MWRCVSAFAVLLAVACATAASAATPTKASWARSANKLCGGEIRALHAIPTPSQNDLPGTAAYIRRVISVGSPYHSRIAALPRPARERAGIADWVRLDLKVRADALTAARAFDARDRVAASEWLAKMLADGHASDVIALRLGATICAQS